MGTNIGRKWAIKWATEYNIGLIWTKYGHHDGPILVLVPLNGKNMHMGPS